MKEQFEDFGCDPIGENKMKAAFKHHSHLVKQAKKLKVAMEQLLLRRSRNNNNNRSSNSNIVTPTVPSDAAATDNDNVRF